MKEFDARDAKNRFGHLLDAAQSAPVRVTKNDRPVGVFMSVDQYDRLRGVALERFAETMDRLGRKAADAGLTEDKLDALLADES